jgi:predicted RNA-binding protein with PUA-like domain
MASYWLLKTEPDCYAWEQILADGRTFWDGIHNYQARNFLRQMKLGDQAFFYHTGGERCIRGVVEIVREAYPDSEDPTWSWVDVQMKARFFRPVSLEELKSLPELQDMFLFKQGRLSVIPVTAREWALISRLGASI